MDCNDTLVRCIFQNPDLNHFNKCKLHLLTNINKLGGCKPGLQNEGTQIKDTEWCWLFYVEEETTFKFKLSKCEPGSCMDNTQEDGENYHEFFVPKLNIDEAVSLNLFWNNNYKCTIIPKDSIKNENEYLFEKLETVIMRGNQEGNTTEEIVDNDQENLVEVSRNTDIETVVVKLDSMDYSTMGKSVSNSYINKNEGLVPFKNMESSSALMNTREKLEEIDSEITKENEDSELFAMKETDDGLMDIDKLLLGSLSESKDESVEHVRVYASNTEPTKPVPSVFIAKIRALLRFGFKHSDKGVDEDVTNASDESTDVKDECNLSELNDKNDVGNEKIEKSIIEPVKLKDLAKHISQESVSKNDNSTELLETKGYIPVDFLNEIQTNNDKNMNKTEIVDEMEENNDNQNNKSQKENKFDICSAEMRSGINNISEEIKIEPINEDSSENIINTDGILLHKISEVEEKGSCSEKETNVNNNSKYKIDEEDITKKCLCKNGKYSKSQDTINKTKEYSSNSEIILDEAKNIKDGYFSKSTDDIRKIRENKSIALKYQKNCPEDNLDDENWEKENINKKFFKELLEDINIERIKDSSNKYLNNDNMIIDNTNQQRHTSKDNLDENVNNNDILFTKICKVKDVKESLEDMEEETGNSDNMEDNFKETVKCTNIKNVNDTPDEFLSSEQEPQMDTEGYSEKKFDTDHVQLNKDEKQNLGHMDEERENSDKMEDNFKEAVKCSNIKNVDDTPDKLLSSEQEPQIDTENSFERKIIEIPDHYPSTSEILAKELKELKNDYQCQKEKVNSYNIGENALNKVDVEEIFLEKVMDEDNTLKDKINIDGIVNNNENMNRIQESINDRQIQDISEEFSNNDDANQLRNYENGSEEKINTNIKLIETIHTIKNKKSCLEKSVSENKASEDEIVKEYIKTESPTLNIKGVYAGNIQNIPEEYTGNHKMARNEEKKLKVINDSNNERHLEENIDEEVMLREEINNKDTGKECFDKINKAVNEENLNIISLENLNTCEILMNKNQIPENNPGVPDPFLNHMKLDKNMQEVNISSLIENIINEEVPEDIEKDDNKETKIEQSNGCSIEKNVDNNNVMQDNLSKEEKNKEIYNYEFQENNFKLESEKGEYIRKKENNDKYSVDTIINKEEGDYKKDNDTYLKENMNEILKNNPEVRFENYNENIIKLADEKKTFDSLSDPETLLIENDSAKKSKNENNKNNISDIKTEYTEFKRKDEVNSTYQGILTDLSVDKNQKNIESYPKKDTNKNVESLEKIGFTYSYDCISHPNEERDISNITLCLENHLQRGGKLEKITEDVNAEQNESLKVNCFSDDNLSCKNDQIISKEYINEQNNSHNKNVFIMNENKKNKDELKEGCGAKYPIKLSKGDNNKNNNENQKEILISSEDKLVQYDNSELFDKLETNNIQNPNTIRKEKLLSPDYKIVEIRINDSESFESKKLSEEYLVASPQSRISVKHINSDKNKSNIDQIKLKETNLYEVEIERSISDVAEGLVNNIFDNLNLKSEKANSNFLKVRDQETKKSSHSDKNTINIIDINLIHNKSDQQNIYVKDIMKPYSINNCLYPENDEFIENTFDSVNENNKYKEQNSVKNNFLDETKETKFKKLFQDNLDLKLNDNQNNVFIKNTEGNTKYSDESNELSKFDNNIAQEVNGKKFMSEINAEKPFNIAYSDNEPVNDSQKYVFLQSDLKKTMEDSSKVTKDTKEKNLTLIDSNLLKSELMLNYKPYCQESNESSVVTSVSKDSPEDHLNNTVDGNSTNLKTTCSQSSINDQVKRQSVISLTESTNKMSSDEECVFSLVETTNNKPFIEESDSANLNIDRGDIVNYCDSLVGQNTHTTVEFPSPHNYLFKKSIFRQDNNPISDSKTELLFYEDQSEYNSMLNPMLITFINKTSQNKIGNTEKVNLEKMQKKQYENKEYLSFDTDLSSNRDSAIICDSDSQSGLGTLIHDDSYNELIYKSPMTASHTVDSLFVSNSKQNASDKKCDSEESISIKNSHQESLNKPVRPTQYCSLPIPPRTGLKRSPALEGVCDLLNKTDEELEIIQRRTYLVNDDDLFPDSVTPTKADSNLRIEGTLYDIPYIDDEPYKDIEILAADYRWTERQYGIRLADCDECTLDSFKMEQSPYRRNPEIITSLPIKEPKRKRKWFRFCSCLSRCRR